MTHRVPLVLHAFGQLAQRLVNNNGWRRVRSYDFARGWGVVVARLATFAAVCHLRPRDRATVSSRDCDIPLKKDSRIRGVCFPFLRTAAGAAAAPLASSIYDPIYLSLPLSPSCCARARDSMSMQSERRRPNACQLSVIYGPGLKALRARVSGPSF
jgi:hypothetical protein